jgi:hypothetical protein
LNPILIDFSQYIAGEGEYVRGTAGLRRVFRKQEVRMKKLAFTLAGAVALGMAAPSDANAWGYRHGWGGVGAGLAIGALAGGLIAASTASAYAYPTYGYGYGYPAYGYDYGYAPAQVIVVRRRVAAPAYYGGYYGGYGVRRVGYYGGYYRPRVVHYGGYGVRRVGYYGGYGVGRAGYYGGIRRGYGVGVGGVGRWR